MAEANDIWQHLSKVEEAAQITLTAEEICRLEKQRDEIGVHPRREFDFATRL